MAEFAIMMNGKIVGNAIMEPLGLYYRFRCQCAFSDAEIHTIWVRWERGNRKLGVCVPYGTQYLLETKVPAKYFPDSKLTFTVDYREETKDDFYPVNPEEPFGLVDKLPQAHFEIRNGKPGLVIPE